MRSEFLQPLLASRTKPGLSEKFVDIDNLVDCAKIRLGGAGYLRVRLAQWATRGGLSRSKVMQRPQYLPLIKHRENNSLN